LDDNSLINSLSRQYYTGIPVNSFAHVIDKTQALNTTLAQRMVFLDVTIGTIIQNYSLDEAGYRGERFSNWPKDVKGNNDLIAITQPGII
jgi:5-methyltetrahydrofolate--homocysteine methyltransferase